MGILVGLLYGASFAAVSYLMVYGFRRAKLSIGTVMVSSELFFGPVLAFFIFTERLSLLQIIGGIVTILAIFFANRSHKD
jgi:drug/metabolite transporter (DMT)-like permease